MHRSFVKEEKSSREIEKDIYTVHLHKIITFGNNTDF